MSIERLSPTYLSLLLIVNKARTEPCLRTTTTRNSKFRAVTETWQPWSASRWFKLSSSHVGWASTRIILDAQALLWCVMLVGAFLRPLKRLKKSCDPNASCESSTLSGTLNARCLYWCLTRMIEPLALATTSIIRKGLVVWVEQREQMRRIKTSQTAPSTSTLPYNPLLINSRRLSRLTSNS